MVGSTPTTSTHEERDLGFRSCGGNGKNLLTIGFLWHLDGGFLLN